MCSTNVWRRPATPTGRDTNRQQTDDVVRSVHQSSSMADQSRQIKLAAAKKKVKYFTIHPSKYSGKRWYCLSSAGSWCRCLLSFCYSHISSRSRGVVITRRPTTALSLVPPLMLLSGLRCAGESGASPGPLLIALTFPDYADYF